ncbi:MAG: hypothetical protein N2037_11870, partial [Acidimicrobiales bacterium]|nr:hypothetical protein [Acidimicrobiales bacterium]
LVDRAIQLSLEERGALGTAGALGQLRWWIDGRATLTVNADTYSEAELTAFVADWDGERTRLLLHRADELAGGAGVGAALMPWVVVSRLEPVVSGLYSTVWVPASSEGRLEVVRYDGPFFDCGTPRSYLAANQYLASQAASGSLIDRTASVTGDVSGAVIGAHARIEGVVRNSVVWDGAAVGAYEVLDRAIRTDDGKTVLVR